MTKRSFIIFYGLSANAGDSSPLAQNDKAKFFLLYGLSANAGDSSQGTTHCVS